MSLSCWWSRISRRPLRSATRVYFINDGHIVHESSASEIKPNPHVLQRHVGV